MHSQTKYYSKYIKQRNLNYDDSQEFALPANINRHSGETLPDYQAGLSKSHRKSSRYNSALDYPLSATNRRKPFVPLKDLLQRNHDDRVREYLDKMKGLSIDEIVNT